MPIDIVVMKAVNADNERIAADVRAELAAHGVVGLNLMSSPGSGKTALLEAVLARLGREVRFGVIEGDVYSTRDAERIAAHGVGVPDQHRKLSLTANMIAQLQAGYDAIDVLVVRTSAA
jgi:hydrogenase nickel incorporation protein HypB